MTDAPCRICDGSGFRHRLGCPNGTSPTRREIADKTWAGILDQLRDQQPDPRSALAAAYVWADEDTSGGYADRFLEALEAAGYRVVSAASDPEVTRQETLSAVGNPSHNNGATA